MEASLWKEETPKKDNKTDFMLHPKTNKKINRNGEAINDEANKQEQFKLSI